MCGEDCRLLSTTESMVHVLLHCMSGLHRLFRDVCMFACTLLLALDRLVCACFMYWFWCNVHSWFELWSTLSQSSWIRCYVLLQSDASDGIEQPASLFLVLYSILCPQWSASGKPWSATDDEAEATDDFLTFILNQEHGINNERLQLIFPSVRHSKRTHHMWPHQKDRSAWKKGVFHAHRAQLAVQHI